MKARTKRFIARMLTIAMGLVSFLLLDAVITGALSIVGGLCLLPASLFITNVLWQLSLRRLPKKRSRPVARRHAQAPASPAVAPTLYVVSGGNGTHETEPPHVA